MTEQQVPWWKRFRKGVQTSTEEKKETPEGVWHKCGNCKATMLVTKLKDNLHVCPECNYHEKIDAEDYFKIIYGEGEYEELFDDLIPKDFLKFVDLRLLNLLRSHHGFAQTLELIQARVNGAATFHIFEFHD